MKNECDMLCKTDPLLIKKILLSGILPYRLLRRLFEVIVPSYVQPQHHGARTVYEAAYELHKHKTEAQVHEDHHHHRVNKDRDYGDYLIDVCLLIRVDQYHVGESKEILHKSRHADHDNKHECGHEVQTLDM